ncbi:hypothetical protein GCM10025865_10240 [Paraoerskovia sediminicola]|uniref:CAAX protease self-immunity n=1 Tax=Paraoerskovia sediminicola TaxID=1138587 RepID=A0ABM8G130_9CELL|nr:hypothetical protein [Paraoerskovia sediminicola]BDZ41725.1 hypothetical protein GCM10025865_10240 [Paraoerskovia sediminicola]
MRVTPRVWIALVLVAVQVAVTTALLATVDVDPGASAATRPALFGAVVIPALLSAVVLTLLTSALGWWRPVALDDPGRPRLPRAYLAVPALVVLAGGVGVAAVPGVGPAGAETGLPYLVTLVAAVLLTAYAHELLARGIGVVALRSRPGEAHVWLVSTLLSCALALPWIATGQGLGATSSRSLSRSVSAPRST